MSKSSSRLRSVIGRALLRAAGWRVAGSAPPGIDKAVLLAAPHTSNWDMVFGLPATWVLRVRVQWLGKDSLFAGPVRGRFMRWLGGIPVDRSAPRGLVAQAVQRFAERESLFLAVPPSGTRQSVDTWKSGFYHIARGAGVPVVLGYVDYRRKVAGFGPTLRLTDDVHADMARIREFYAQVTPRYPERVQVPRLREEEETPPP